MSSGKWIFGDESVKKFTYAFENKVFAVYLAEPVADVIAVATTATLFFFQFRKAMKKISE